MLLNLITVDDLTRLIQCCLYSLQPLYTQGKTEGQREENEESNLLEEAEKPDASCNTEDEDQNIPLEEACVVCQVGLQILHFIYFV